MSINLSKVFKKFDDEHCEFERVTDPLNPRPDLCAFLLLHKLLPNDRGDMVCAAEHDEIYLDVDLDALAEVATEDDILTLTRCGVRLDKSTDSLAMFV